MRRPPASEPPVPWRERLLDVPWDVTPLAWWGRLAAWVAMTWWGLSVWVSPMTDLPPLLHLTVILFHEAGHVIFSPLGHTMAVAGGTLGQLLMPLVCAVALVRSQDNFGAAVSLVWMAMSLMDAAVYAYDAAQPVLPLISGGTGADSFHDFIFLFDRFGLMNHARAWARGMHALGALGMLSALSWAAVLLYLQREHLAE